MYFGRLAGRTFHGLQLGNLQASHTSHIHMHLQKEKKYISHEGETAI